LWKLQYYFTGILLVLLCIAGHFLYHWTGAGRKSLALATFAMAILATLQIIIHVYIAVLESQIVRLAIEGVVWPAPPALGPTNLYGRLYLAKDLLLVTNK
jgi:NADH:ubiquinone oxidoreductase subunit 3 (subunit A)